MQRRLLVYIMLSDGNIRVEFFLLKRQFTYRNTYIRQAVRHRAKSLLDLLESVPWSLAFKGECRIIGEVLTVFDSRRNGSLSLNLVMSVPLRDQSGKIRYHVSTNNARNDCKWIN